MRYFHCASCGYARTEDPYWLEEAYSDAIAQSDTGIVQRNLSLSAKLACTLFLSFDHRGAYLDVAGGYGLLTRMMRDYGFDYYWEDKYCANLVARGFEAARSRQSFSALSCFEAIEHTVNPFEFIVETTQRHGCRNFIFSTITYSEPRPTPEWSYLSPSTGQHVSFFQQRTLRKLAERLNLQFYSNAGLHIFSERQLPNAWLLRTLNTPVALFLAQLVRLRIGSRVLTDNQQLIVEAGGQPHSP